MYENEISLENKATVLKSYKKRVERSGENENDKYRVKNKGINKKILKRF